MGRRGIIIGGGASGLAAAIAASENGAEIIIIEHMSRVGKKILSTGNGKCNLTNLNLSPSCYRCSEEGFPMKVIERFPVSRTLSFFRKLGVVTTDRNGYVYPASGQAQTVLDALREKADSLGVKFYTECEPGEILKVKKGFQAATSQGNFTGDFLILAAGSMAAPSTGSDGSGYELARSLGHKIVKPLPALVQLKCRGDYFKSIAGVRTEALVSLYTAGKSGEPDRLLASDRGELQLTDYGISGIPVFQVSRYASQALEEKKRVLAVIDFFPGCSWSEFFDLLKEQRSYLEDRPASAFLNGIFHKKLAAFFLKNGQIKAERRTGTLTDKELKTLTKIVKEAVIDVAAANSFEKAQICMGGVSVREVDPRTMESRRIPDLYFSGEILDVDGICGGYNLQWAWSSGYLAGVSAAKKE